METKFKIKKVGKSLTAIDLETNLSCASLSTVTGKGYGQPKALYFLEDYYNKNRTKYLFIKLKIQDGERSYGYRCLHQTKAVNIYFAAEKYAATFWGESSRNNDGWDAWGGEIHIKLEKVVEVSKKEYKFLHNLFY